MAAVPNEHVQKRGAPRPIRHMHAADQGATMIQTDCGEKRDPSQMSKTAKKPKLGA